MTEPRFADHVNLIHNVFDQFMRHHKDMSSEKPTAIVAYNDLVAIGCLHALSSCGLCVPDDISVIGFDDIFVTPHTNPPLTTVHLPKFKMGQLAVTKIDNILAGRDTDTGGLTLLECPLIVRESTAPAVSTTHL